MNKSSGFTLTELMIAITVLAVMAGVSMPYFKDMMRNKQINGAAESIANGLQRARAEAVARNAKIQFVLGSGTSWTVDYVTKPVSTDPPIESRPSAETANATRTAVALVDLSTAATTITYNQLGQVVANADASPSLGRVTVSAAGGTHDLRVTIGAGGNARVCDPALPPFPTNVRGC